MPEQPSRSRHATELNIIGISAFYHESAACLLQDGRLVAAAEEERFSRIKHDARIPVDAFKFCLRAGGIGIEDVDCVAYYESPVKKLSRQLWSGKPAGAPPGLAWLDAGRPAREIAEVLGHDGPVRSYDHHASHAASAFHYSGFDDAAIFTVDGVGEWDTTAYWEGCGDQMTLIESVEFPHSLGLFYAAITSYLGFRVNDGEYKVMGLAPYGVPRYMRQMQALLRSQPAGQFVLDLRNFDYIRGRRMFTDRLCELFGAPPRTPESALTAFHHDVARSAQFALEEILLEKVRWLATRVDSPNLCLAGGVALNCVANGRIHREGPFRRLFIQPAAGDSGGCLGAAALAHVDLTGARHTRDRMSHAYFGPSVSTTAIANTLDQLGVAAVDHRGDETALVDGVAERLAAGAVVAWFHGPMELGPRALGARSILADPRDPGMRDRLNLLVKKRESFRPFAPSILLEHAPAHLELDDASEFMLETCRVTSPIALPAITHVDGSARPQTVDATQSPRFAALIEAFFRRTGCPLLVNTSFNVRDEPIVCTPLDALACVAESGIDTLVLEDFVIDRAGMSAALVALLRERYVASDRPGGDDTGLLYTFI